MQQGMGQPQGQYGIGQTQNPATSFDRVFIFAPEGIERVLDKRGKWALKDPLELRHVEPWNKSDLIGVQTIVPLQLYSDAHNLGQPIPQGTRVALTTGEQHAPKIIATVLTSGRDMCSMMEPLQIALTIGGTQEKPIYGLIYLKAYLNNFQMKSGVTFCERNEYPTSNELPIPCMLGQKGKVDHEATNIVTPVMPAAEMKYIEHDHNLTLTAGFPYNADSMCAASKKIPEGILGTDAFDGGEGFVLSVTSLEPVLLQDGNILGIRMNPTQPPTDGATLVGDIEITSRRSLLLILRKGEAFEAHEVKDAREMAMVNNEMLRVAKLEPQCELPKTQAAEFSVAGAMKSSIEEVPLTESNFALSLIHPVATLESVANLISGSGHCVVRIEQGKGGNNILSGKLSFLVGPTHVMSAKLEGSADLSQGTCQIGISVTPEGIIGKFVHPTAYIGGVPNLLCGAVYPNRSKAG